MVIRLNRIGRMLADDDPVIDACFDREAHLGRAVRETMRIQLAANALATSQHMC